MQEENSPSAELCLPDTSSQLTGTAGTNRNRHILLAEDNPVNQEVALIMLENMNHSVDVVADGQAAVHAFEQQPYDLILMDCHMPEMDGFAAAQLIREREALILAAPDSPGPQSIPIIALTADVMQGDREGCLVAGMNDHLGKPFTQEALQAILICWAPQPRLAA